MGAAGARTVAMLATVSLAAFVASGRQPIPSVGLSWPTIRCRGRSARAVGQHERSVSTSGRSARAVGQHERSVSTSGPSAVMATVCSACAPREPSLLRKVHPSASV
jgi:hypothetical protein